jgi:hypothetical protein
MVSFAESVITSLHTYPAPSVENKSTLFYNSDDYERFRMERAQEEMIQSKIDLASKAGESERNFRRQHQRFSYMLNRKPVSPQKRDLKLKGVAKAA